MARVRPNTKPKTGVPEFTPGEAVAVWRVLHQFLMGETVGLNVSFANLTRAYDKFAKLHGRMALPELVHYRHEAKVRAQRLATARREEPPPWLAGYLPKPGDTFWAIFDGDNGGPESHLYVWWFPTRAIAREYKRHMDEVYPDRRVSKPIVCKVIPTPKPARARPRSHSHRKPAPSRAKRARTHREPRDQGLTGEGRRFVVDGKVTFQRMEER